MWKQLKLFEMHQKRFFVPAYDHGLPKKHIPFTTGASRQTLAGSLSVASSKTMGVAPVGQLSRAAHALQIDKAEGDFEDLSVYMFPLELDRLPLYVLESELGAFELAACPVLHVSRSAPSIPRDSQCYGYDEAGDGRLIRQNRKDGIQQLSGKPGDSAGPGQYDSHKCRVMANGALGGRIMPPSAEPVTKPSETPGPGHYVTKGIAQSEKPVYSAFASQSERGPSKHEHKAAAEMPGPGQYIPRINRRPNMRELHPELQYFGSTAERFKEDEAAVIASQLPGPGQYGVPRHQNKGKSFAWLKGKRFQEPKQKDIRPGPGAYYNAKTFGRNGSVSILGGSGTLAFGSMEARRGVSDPRKGQEPGPGAYYEGVEGDATSSRKPRKVVPPSSFFRSTVPKDVMVAQYQKDGQIGPPPGAYSPRAAKDLGTIQRLAPKNEGFGSASQRLQGEVVTSCGPGPGWYKVKDVTGGKIQGTFNRHAVEAAPACGMPRGLGFESQAKRFGLGDPKGEAWTWRLEKSARDGAGVRPFSRARARSPGATVISGGKAQGPSQNTAYGFQSAAQNRSSLGGSGTLAASGNRPANLRTSTGNVAAPEARSSGRSSRLSVVVRKRPMNKREVQTAQQDVVFCRESAVVVREPKLKVDLTRYVEEHNFLFDKAFDENATNESLYRSCVQPVIDAVFQKAKCTCFAYGQTGSGKTFTMMGPPKRLVENLLPEERPPGIFLLASQDLFRGLESKEYAHLGVFIAFYEIYCGKLFDLLNNRQVLHARENAKGNVVIAGLQEHPVGNVQDLMEVIECGLNSRTTGVTGANVDSSRSHAILQISLKDLESKEEHGKISFIDLAGSERGADTLDTHRQTRMDGAEINKSLLALKECIRALDQQLDHTPFRGSKLTQVLKDSFIGANCRTVMIANVSPCSGAVEHSLNTLRYAYRVKELRSAPSKPSGAVPAGSSSEPLPQVCATQGDLTAVNSSDSEVEEIQPPQAAYRAFPNDQASPHWNGTAQRLGTSAQVASAVAVANAAATAALPGQQKEKDKEVQQQPQQHQQHHQHHQQSTHSQNAHASPHNNASNNSPQQKNHSQNNKGQSIAFQPSSITQDPVPNLHVSWIHQSALHQHGQRNPDFG
ncbi:Kinesin-related protein 6 (Kinesin family member 6) (Kinesin-13) [Durusdinium trenchii]|uniref:Kinesin-related protein 6 (Kinesin family member 6) (Kinesin-13) n=1 Tax=Durusdinium trenchii TaxID=1381693 RepID=A0ABP0KR61_9DINO